MLHEHARPLVLFFLSSVKKFLAKNASKAKLSLTHSR